MKPNPISNLLVAQELTLDVTEIAAQSHELLLEDCFSGCDFLFDGFAVADGVWSRCSGSCGATAGTGARGRHFDEGESGVYLGGDGGDNG